MNVVLLLLWTLMKVILTATYLKLQKQDRLYNGDSIISTRGYYKMTLISNCSLSLSRFDTPSLSYLSTNQQYRGNYNGQCNWLQIIDNRIMTDQSNVFLQLNFSNFSLVFLMIDDTAVIRFIGFKNPTGNISPLDFQQIVYDKFLQPNSYINIMQNYTTISNTLTTITNNNGWMFTIDHSQLIITNFNTQNSFNFSIPSIYFSLNGIFDANNQTIPNSNFAGMIYQTVCANSKSSLYGPFVLQIDLYWPILAIYDQQGYKLLQFSALNEETSNPCPEHTFFMGVQCLLTCPSPYYHKIQSNKGSCVLNCEYGSTIDIPNRVCKCPNRITFVTSSYVCVNTSSYLFGCYCNNSNYFDLKSRKCLPSCQNSQQGYAGICISCSKNCLNCSFNTNELIKPACTQCKQGYNLTQGLCVPSTNCSSKCSLCLNSVCVACLPFYALYNNNCVEQCPFGMQVTSQNNFTSQCSITPSNNCIQDCILCNNSICIICQIGYSLFITPIMVTCRKKTLLFSCSSSLYQPLFNDSICYSNDTVSLFTLTQCQSSIKQCQLCHYNQTNLCLVCKKGYVLQQNSCVNSCSTNYMTINQGCIKQLTNCEIGRFKVDQRQFNLGLDTIVNSSIYQSYISHGYQPTDQPYGYQLYASQNFYFDNNVREVSAKAGWQKQICVQCQNGFGLSPDYQSCLSCPPGCLLCYVAGNNSCLATTNDELLMYTMGSSISKCQTFITQNYNCLLSCPAKTIPAINSTLNKMQCVASSDDTVSQYLKVDGTSIQIGSSQFIHKFIFSEKINSKLNRLLQNSSLIDASGNSVTIQSNRPTQVLNLTGQISLFSSVGGQYPVNSVYGVNSQSSFSTYIKKWLAGIGYVISFLILITNTIYVANSILYKMDNIIIFAQTTFFFLFQQIWISNPIAQYYYGWSWAHLNFYPNYFTPELYLSEPTIIPYALYNLDANIIRNSGSSLSLLLTFSLIWAVSSAIIYFLDTFCGKKQIWYYRISKNSIIAAMQFFSYNIFYWCIAFINYDKNYLTQGTFIGLTVLLLITIVIYTVARLYFNLIGGIYMIKRIVYASILASSYQNTGFIGLIIAFQIVFSVARSLIEKPKQTGDLVALWIEEGLIIVFTIILYTCSNASVVAILVTIFIYGWFLTFIADLFDLYLISKNKFLDIGCFRHLFKAEKENIKTSEDDFEQGHTDRPFHSKINSQQVPK